jgi:hypothetical protein
MEDEESGRFGVNGGGLAGFTAEEDVDVEEE